MTTPRPDHPVARIMSWPVATIDHDASLLEAAEALGADNIGALLVLRDGALVGIVSERDVVAHLSAGTHLDHLLVGEAMAAELVTVPPATTIAAAARTMAEADIRHLPVLDGRLIAGLVSVRDVIGVLATAVENQDVVVVRSGTHVVVTEG
ncbi:MAG TPA: CBS domain-containing protein [Nocardioides sp.]|uniref:CBS domain-containing protein n=1 Tax=uncultured Nocardioides sp. TaxID=198441 RepID=UPI000EC29B0B|nr:CBS domain-containing protein [uncultured Nocardioides sp.]HCB06679.1 histidine kinase [Nocardioides sp.]HRD61719.1 CBS domain-containing protein [Nocardioides sp.]HRI97714.1 CBS domain-containing protein [Nocardioides sp.]